MSTMTNQFLVGSPIRRRRRDHRHVPVRVSISGKPSPGLPVCITAINEKMQYQQIVLNQHDFAKFVVACTPSPESVARDYLLGLSDEDLLVLLTKVLSIRQKNKQATAVASH